VPSRAIRIVFVASAAVALAPFAVMAWHAFPSADDYCLAVEVRKGFWPMQRFFYEEWTGRYAAILFQAILSRWDLASLYPWFCLGTLVATLVSFRSLLATMWEGGRTGAQVTGAALIAMAVYVIQMPSSTEGFFWMTSALSYRWALIIYPVWLSSLVASVRASGAAGGVGTRVVATVLTALMPGFAEVFAPLVLLTLASFLVYCVRHRREAQGFVLALLVLAGLLTAVSLLAPGNSVRSESYPANPTRHSLEFAVLETVRQTFRFLASYGIHPALWVAALASVVWKLPVRASIDRALDGGRGLVLILAGTLAGVYLTLFPLYWEYGEVNYTGEGRTYNVTYFVLCVGSALFVRSLLRFLAERRPQLWTLAPVRLRDRAIAALLVLGLLASPAARRAYLAARQAPEYLRSQQRREAVLRAPENRGRDLIVDDLSIKPVGLFWGDLAPEPDHWINSCVAAYYGVGSVRTPRPLSE
jgi:hypothetical protein